MPSPTRVRVLDAAVLLLAALVAGGCPPPTKTPDAGAVAATTTTPHEGAKAKTPTSPPKPTRRAADAPPPSRTLVYAMARFEAEDGSGTWEMVGDPLPGARFYDGDTPNGVKPGVYVLTFDGASLGDYPHLLFREGSGRWSIDFGFGDDSRLEGTAFENWGGLMQEPDAAVRAVEGQPFVVEWDYREVSFSCCHGDPTTYRGLKPSILSIRPLDGDLPAAQVADDVIPPPTPPSSKESVYVVTPTDYYVESAEDGGERGFLVRERGASREVIIRVVPYSRDCRPLKLTLEPLALDGGAQPEVGDGRWADKTYLLETRADGAMARLSPRSKLIGGRLPCGVSTQWIRRRKIDRVLVADHFHSGLGDFRRALRVRFNVAIPPGYRLEGEVTRDHRTICKGLVEAAVRPSTDGGPAPTGQVPFVPFCDGTLPHRLSPQIQTVRFSGQLRTPDGQTHAVAHQQRDALGGLSDSPIFVEPPNRVRLLLTPQCPFVDVLVGNAWQRRGEIFAHRGMPELEGLSRILLARPLAAESMTVRIIEEKPEQTRIDSLRVTQGGRPLTVRYAPSVAAAALQHDDRDRFLLNPGDQLLLAVDVEAGEPVYLEGTGFYVPLTEQ